MSTNYCNIESSRKTAVTKCDNKLNIAQYMLSILNVLKKQWEL